MLAQRLSSEEMQEAVDESPHAKKRRLDSVGGNAVSSTAHHGRSNPRKSTAACTACRKQKIRCEMLDDEPPCARCSRRGLSCILHTARSGVDARHISTLGSDVQNIFSTVERVCQKLGIEGPPKLISAPKESTGAHIEMEHSGDEGMCELSPAASPSTVAAPIDSFLGKASSEGAANGRSPQTLRQRRTHGRQGRQDIISKGLVTHDNALALVDRYVTRLDHFIYGLASQYRGDLEGLRKASPVLLAAICAVSALHDPDRPDLFDICNREFRQLVSSSLFEKNDSEFIRALCIGSFWLLDLSRILVSDAVRRSADARLHSNIYPLLNLMPNNANQEGQPDKLDAVKLFYLLFISDQHLSVLHNRDRLIPLEKKILDYRDSFLSRQGASNQDVRITSQVNLLFMMGQMRDIFGSELPQPVSKTLSVQFNHFLRELQEWFSKFSALFEPDPDIGDFPRAGLCLHFEFGKLYLAHHVFRGLQDDPIPPHFVFMANTGYQAARSIFQMILHNEALKENLVGVPHYFHVMISFAGHFLLELCMKYRDQLNIVAEDDVHLVGAALAQIANLTVLAQHPISRITTHLMRRLSDCATNLGLQHLLSGSPLGGLEGSYAAARDFGLDMMNGQPHDVTSLIPLQNPMLPGDFIYTDFGDFSFLDPQCEG